MPCRAAGKGSPAGSPYAVAALRPGTTVFSGCCPGRPLAGPLARTTADSVHPIEQSPSDPNVVGACRRPARPGLPSLPSSLFPLHPCHYAPFGDQNHLGMGFFPDFVVDPSGAAGVPQHGVGAVGHVSHFPDSRDLRPDGFLVIVVVRFLPQHQFHFPPEYSVPQIMIAAGNGNENLFHRTPTFPFLTSIIEKIVGKMGDRIHEKGLPFREVLSNSLAGIPG